MGQRKQETHSCQGFNSYHTVDNKSIKDGQFYEGTWTQESGKCSVKSEKKMFWPRFAVQRY